MLSPAVALHRRIASSGNEIGEHGVSFPPTTVPLKTQ
jgi:hypothetical protein